MHQTQPVSTPFQGVPPHRNVAAGAPPVGGKVRGVATNGTMGVRRGPFAGGVGVAALNGMANQAPTQPHSQQGAVYPQTPGVTTPVHTAENHQASGFQYGRNQATAGVQTAQQPSGNPTTYSQYNQYHHNQLNANNNQAAPPTAEMSRMSLHPTSSTTPQPSGTSTSGGGTRPVMQNYYQGTAAFDYGNANCVQQQPQYDQHTQAMVQDALKFNAFPHFVRASVGRLPNSQSVKQKVYVPLGVVFRPLAPTPQGYPIVTTVNFGGSVVVRCKRCRTYINPFVQWESNGRRWTCNLCGFQNDVPQFYCRSLDDTGKRDDRLGRPELSMGSVEFIAPSDYMVRPPQPPAYMFIIDVSYNSVCSGMLDTVCDGIKRVVSDDLLPGGARSMMGIMTYDNTVHFYNLNANLQQSHMHVVADLEELFLPLSDDILVNTYDSKRVILHLLEQLPRMWRSNRTNECATGSALKVGHMAMKQVGGKLCVFMSTIPTLGEMQLKPNRDSAQPKHGQQSVGSSSTTPDIEMELMKPVNDSYKNFAQNLTQSQLGVDVFVCTQYNADLASIAPVCKNTSGELHYYPSFNSHAHGDKLREEIIRVLTREQGWEAVMRFRVSRGWKITSWNGHFYFRGVDLMVIPNSHCDQTFSITLDLEESVVSDPLVYFQSALLFTNSDGERRIRVHTFCIPTSQNSSDILATVDPHVVSSLLARQAIGICLKSKLADGRNFIQSMLSQILSSTAAQQFEGLKALPLYVLGMLKSAAFRESKDVTADLRVFHWTRLESIPLELQIAFFYPRMIAMHNLETHHGTIDETQQVVLPPSTNLSSQVMTQDGVYVLEDGESMLMWIGKGISQKWLESVFGVHTLDYLHPDYAESSIGTTGDPYGTRVAAIIQAIRHSRPAEFLKLTIIRQGDPTEHKFFGSLIEDRTHSMMLSYTEFLAKLAPRTQQVQNAAVLGNSAPPTAAVR